MMYTASLKYLYHEFLYLICDLYLTRPCLLVLDQKRLAVTLEL